MTIRLATNSAGLAHFEVLHVVGDGATGGGTTAVMQMARGMAARGARVTIASSDRIAPHPPGAPRGTPSVGARFQEAPNHRVRSSRTY